MTTAKRVVGLQWLGDCVLTTEKLGKWLVYALRACFEHHKVCRSLAEARRFRSTNTNHTGGMELLEVCILTTTKPVKGLHLLVGSVFTTTKRVGS